MHGKLKISKILGGTSLRLYERAHGIEEVSHMLYHVASAAVKLLNFEIEYPERVGYISYLGRVRRAEFQAGNR